MKQSEFEDVAGRFMRVIWSTLTEKRDEYGSPGEDDVFARFSEIAERTETNVLEAIHTLKTKHDVSIDQFFREESNGFPPRPLDKWQEKLVDQMAYCILTWCWLNYREDREETSIKEQK